MDRGDSYHCDVNEIIRFCPEMDKQEAIYQKLCQIHHTAYEMSTIGDKSQLIDERVSEVLESELNERFKHDPDRCRECKIGKEITKQWENKN